MGLGWNANAELLSQAPSKTVTSDSGPEHAKTKTTWLHAPKSHCFCPRTATCLGVGEQLRQYNLTHHTQLFPSHRLEQGKAMVYLSSEIRKAKEWSIVMSLRLKLTLLQTLPFHLPSRLQNVP